MRLLLALVLCLIGSVACAADIEPTPNLPAATGDQVWVVRNGRVVGKLNASDLENGEYVQVGSKMLGCFPRPQQPPVPQYPTPPPFVAPAPPVVIGPPAPEGGVDLLSIALSVIGGLGGYVYGKKVAKDDDDTDPTDAEVVAAV